MIRIVIVLTLVACTVNRRTPGLACGSNADCKTGGTCTSGYCIGGGSGSGTCDPACTSGCTLSTDPPQCRISSSAGGRTITCPMGFACSIDCNGTGACGTITCSQDACTVQCTGSNACGTIDCSNASCCQVTCSAGACGANDCPTDNQGAQCKSNNVCTTSGPGCNC